MAPGVYQTFVIDVVRSTLTCGYNMIRFYIFSWSKWDGTQGASIPLSLVQYQPLFRIGFPSHLSLGSFLPIFSQGWVIGRISSCDLGEARDRGFVGLDQFCLLFLECPVAIISEVADLDPLTTFVWVSAFRPVPEHLPLGMPDLREDLLGCRVPVIIRPSSYNWVEFLRNGGKITFRFTFTEGLPSSSILGGPSQRRLACVF